jgi:hypothetical protein
MNPKRGGRSPPYKTSRPCAESENAGARNYEDVGCSLTISSHAVVVGISRPRSAPRRVECGPSGSLGAGLGSVGAPDWVRSAPGIGFGRRGGLGSLGARDWVRSAGREGQDRAAMPSGGHAEPQRGERVADNWVRSARGGLGSVGAGDWLRSAREIGFAWRRRLGSVGAGGRPGWLWTGGMVTSSWPCLYWASSVWPRRRDHVTRGINDKRPRCRRRRMPPGNKPR